MSNANCFQSREVTGVCDVCDSPADSMHLPSKPRGIYCEKHCPACSLPSMVALAAIHRDPKNAASHKDSDFEVAKLVS
jgi:hypothetical protein